MAIEYLIEKYQPEVLQDLLNELALGNNLDNAFRKVLGYDTLEFESILKEYINESFLKMLPNLGSIFVLAVRNRDANYSN